MTSPILLVRHGETDSNASRVVQFPDARLSATGRQQAERLAGRIAECGIAHILCSDMARALETAAPIAARTGVPLTTDPLLRERDFGDLRGTPYAELRVDPFAIDYAPPNGETVADFHERVGQAWMRVTQLAARVPGSLLVVTHGLVCHALIERHLCLGEGAVAPALHPASAGRRGQRRRGSLSGPPATRVVSSGQRDAARCGCACLALRRSPASTGCGGVFRDAAVRERAAEAAAGRTVGGPRLIVVG